MSKVVSFKIKGDLKKSDGFLHKIVQRHYEKKLHHYGVLGVQALQAATPKKSGTTADSWSYEIAQEGNRLGLYWKNDNRVNGVLIAILLQYGHGTRNGGWVEGLDYINPALRPIFDKMANEIWKEVVG